MKENLSNLFTSEFVEFFDPFGQLIDGDLEPTAANDIFEEFQHSVFVFSQRFRLHHRDLFNFTLQQEILQN